jgi:hypothetical protein
MGERAAGVSIHAEVDAIGDSTSEWLPRSNPIMLTLGGDDDMSTDAPACVSRLKPSPALPLLSDFDEVSSRAALERRRFSFECSRCAFACASSAALTWKLSTEEPVNSIRCRERR